LGHVPTGASGVSAAREAATAPGRAGGRTQSRTLDPASLPDHVDRLYRAAWALSGSREEAEDLVQETFARVLAKPRSLHGDELGYLLRVLRNTFLTSRRTASRRPHTVAELELGDQRTGGSAESRLEARETFAAIAALPAKYRETLVAVDIVGLSYKEAGKALGTREATITSRLFRARQQVVRAMDGTPPSGVLDQ
jgi:RNA polymerase sigma-70 factor (ECF subfamily)